MNIRYVIELADEERTQLQELTRSGQAQVRRVKRAQLLLAAEQGHHDSAIAATLGVGTSTVYRVKRRFVEGGLEAALNEAPRDGAKRKLNGRQETLLVAVACSDPPPGRARWTLELLADEIVQRTEHESVSRETVRVVLDNLSSHKPAALYEVFAPEVARGVLRRLEFHFVPKHASWLNMVEIEIGVLGKQCLDRRIGDCDTLCREVAHWQHRRNAAEARVEWLFDVHSARRKLGRVYPTPASPDFIQAA